MTKTLILYFHNEEGRLSSFEIGVLPEDGKEYHFAFAVEKE